MAHEVTNLEGFEGADVRWQKGRLGVTVIQQPTIGFSQVGSAARTGLRGLRWDDTIADVASYRIPLAYDAQGNPHFRANGNGKKHVRAQVYFRHPDAISGTNMIVMLSQNIESGIFSSPVIVELTSSGELRLTGSAGPVQAPVPTPILSGVWYRLNVGLDADAGTCELRVNGIVEVTTTAATVGADVDFLALGFIGSLNIWHFDDIVIESHATSEAAIDWPLEAGVYQLIPDGDSAGATEQGGTANGAANKWECIDEVPPDDDTTYVEFSLVEQYVATLGSIPPEIGSISAAKFQSMWRDTGLGINTAQVRQVRIRRSDTGSVFAISTMTQSTQTYDVGIGSLVRTVSPFAGSPPWIAIMNSVETGMQRTSGVAAVRLTAVNVQFAASRILDVIRSPGVVPSPR